jgi:predicted permease
MQTLLQDVRHGVRLLWKTPAFTAVAVVTLALGIGANTTIFSITNALLLQPVPVREPDRLVSLYTTDKKNPGFSPTSHLNWKDYRDKLQCFSGLLGYDWVGMSVNVSGEPRIVVGQLVSGNYFDVLGVKAALGRTFLPEEDGAPGGHPVAVVSHGFWQTQLGGDPALVGRRLSINAQPFTVIGVAPASFTGTDVGVRPELWLPMAMNRVIRSDPATNWYEERRGLFVNTIGRLRPGKQLAEARADAQALAANLEKDFPDDNKGRSATLVPLSQASINPGFRAVVVRATALLMTVVGLVLLVACANVSNLLLVRALSRRREIAVRLALGASRTRLVRQLLTESVLLAVPGAALGVLVALWARGALLAFLPTLPFPITQSLRLDLDWRVLTFTFVVALASTLLFGLLPALQASRAQVVDDLKDLAGIHKRAPFGLGARHVLIAGQVALSLVALIGAALFLRSLGAAQRTDPGFETKNLLAMGFDVGRVGMTRERAEAFFREVVERVSGVPGVAKATLAQGGPLQGTLLRSVFLEGGDPNDRTFVQVNVVAAGYFDTMGIPVVRGRALGERDAQGAPKAVVVNETMASRLWPKADALGKRFRFFNDPQMSEVVGIAKDVKYNGLGEDPQPYVYESLGQRHSSALTLIVRTSRPPETVLESVRKQLASLDRDLPIVGARTISQVLHNSLWAPRMGASLLALFGSLALILAAVGIYGVMSYAAKQRQREIGIRIALGARRADILGLLVRQGMSVVLLGVAIGLLIAFGATRLVANMLFGISATDTASFAATALLLAFVALLANLLPARRATSVDPTVALRQQ